MPIPNNHAEMDEASVACLVSLLGVGRKNATASYTLQSEMGFAAQQTSESVRALVEYAIKEHNWAIGSCSKGYFLIANEEELDEVIKSLADRAAGINARAAAIENAWYTRNP